MFDLQKDNDDVIDNISIQMTSTGIYEAKISTGEYDTRIQNDSKWQCQGIDSPNIYPPAVLIFMVAN